MSAAAGAVPGGVPGAATETMLVEAVRRALFEEMERDERVFVLGEDVGVYGGAFKATAGLIDRFGAGRVIDTPISEDAIVGAAIGAAYNGMLPVAEMQFMDFVSNALTQIVNFAAKSRYRWGAGCPLVVRGPVGAGVSGGPFHSQSPEMFFCPHPGLKVVFPSSARDALGLLKSSIRDPDPVIFLEHKFLYRRVKEILPEGEVIEPLGKARVVRPGRDLTVVTWGAPVWTALEVAGKVAGDGIEVEVVDLRTLVPFDEATVLESVRKTAKAIVLHEAQLTGGFGGEVAARIGEKAFEWLDGPVRRLAALDTPVPFAPPLEKAYLPGPEKLEALVREVHGY